MHTDIDNRTLIAITQEKAIAFYGETVYARKAAQLRLSIGFLSKKQRMIYDKWAERIESI